MRPELEQQLRHAGEVLEGRPDVPEHAGPRRAFWRWYLDQAVPTVDRALVA